MFTLFGLNFHLYGLIVGLALVTAITLVEKKAKNQGIVESDFWSLVMWVIVSGVLGARLWHVATDFHLYQTNMADVVKLWNGGLSILGGVAGGMIGLWFWQKKFPEKVSTKKILDLAIFGLPIGQAIGRWGNYVNQELYGLPTTLPWGISIDPEYRLPEFSQFQTFHPLFAYEMIATAIFGVGIWWFDARQLQQKQKSLVGSGLYFWAYVLYYSMIRFGLDFVRVEKAVFAGIGLGVNQLVLLGVISVAGFIIFGLSKKMQLMTLVMIVFVFLSAGCSPPRFYSQQPAPSIQNLQQLPDRSRVPIMISDQVLTVELVNTSDSIIQGLSQRQEIGADGMLFALGQAQVPSFWMKDMQFDLDLVWIANEEVVEVTAEVPAPSANLPLHLLPKYSPAQPINIVLELPAGQAKELGIAAGDRFQLVTENL